MRGWTRFLSYVHFSQSVQLRDGVNRSSVVKHKNRRLAEEGEKRDYLVKMQQIIYCAFCVPVSDGALQFVLWENKRLSWSLAKSKRKPKHMNKPWLIKCAHYLCCNKWLHISWPEVDTKAISQGDLRIKDLSQIDLFSAVCTVFFLSKVREREVKYLHTVL